MMVYVTAIIATIILIITVLVVLKGVECTID